MNILREKQDLEIAKEDLENLLDKIEDPKLLHNIFSICAKIQVRINELPIKEKDGRK